MKQIIFIIVFTFAVNLITHAQTFFMLKDTSEVVEFYTNGSIESEIETILFEYMDEINALNIDENSTVVFDIDETCLSNFNLFRAMGFEWSQAGWDKWVSSIGPQAIPPVHDFYTYLLRRGFKVIFITGREADEYEWTLSNLREHGYTQFDTLICKPDELSNLTAQEYKTKTREELSKAGYNIMINTGDQFSDILGGYSGIRIKLPNYMYYIR